MDEILDSPSLALSPPCCVAYRSRSFGYAPSSRLAWRRNGGGLTINNFVHGALALYVVLYSPVQMAADLLEHYEGNPAFQFIRDVGVDWEQSQVLNGEVGSYLTIARQERGTDKWFLGSITNADARELNVKLGFLPAGKKYAATLYADGPDAHWDDNPLNFTISKYLVDADTEMSLRLAPGGGAALSLLPATAEDEQRLKPY